MIDENCIERHYIVKKEEEKTIVEIPDEDNIVEEEVLFKALGFSIYQMLNKSNLLFEGWRDKKLFKTALERVPSEFKEIKSKFRNVGLSHSLGVKSIRNVVQVFEFTHRDILIISDNDDAAVEKQKEFNKEKLYGKWLKYSDVDKKFKQVTGEDFLKIDYVKKCIIDYKKQNSAIKTDPDFEKFTKGVLSILENWLVENDIKGEAKKDVLNKIKDVLFEGLKPSDITNDYHEFLSLLANHLNLTNVETGSTIRV